MKLRSSKKRKNEEEQRSQPDDGIATTPLALVPDNKGSSVPNPSLINGVIKEGALGEGHAQLPTSNQDKNEDGACSGSEELLDIPLPKEEGAGPSKSKRSRRYSNNNGGGGERIQANAKPTTRRSGGGTKVTRKKKEERGGPVQKKKGKRKPPPFQIPYTNKKMAKELTNTAVSELASTKEGLSQEEKLQLSSWGLPLQVIEKYKAKGVTSFFPWQLECLDNERVLGGKNLLYSAPTSAGKTLVAEILMLKRVMELGRKAIMILPFVSVCREKMYGLQELFGDAGIRVEGFMGSYGPPGGFRAVDIAICTIEKANSLINRLLEENLLHQLGTIVVDELHLIGDPHRGYLLELLLTKIKFMVQCQQKLLEMESGSSGSQDSTISNSKRLNIQVIGMSATLPNLELLSDWLDAELVITNYRPVPLVERICFNGKIYDPEVRPVRDVHFPNLPFLFRDDDSYLIYLSLETVLAGHSVLIFCPTKAQCEAAARRISEEFRSVGMQFDSSNPLIADAAKGLRKQLNTGGIMEVLSQLQNCPGGLEDVLKQTVSFGVAYHHAGLTLEERDIVESAFKRSMIRVIVATSTLSAGVNLPARRVIISSPMSVMKQVLDVMTYRQMCGRAGRKGVDTEGESILVCTNYNKETGIRLVRSDMPFVKSALLGHEGELSSSMKRALLEVIASGVANLRSDVEQYGRCTLLSKSIDAGLHNDDDNDLTSSQAHKDETIRSCLQFLEEKDFIRLRHYEDENKPDEYTATQLGMACLAASLAPDEGIKVFKELDRAKKHFVLDSDLHVVYQVTPIYVSEQLRYIDWHHFFSMWEDLSEQDQEVGRLVGVEEAFLINAIGGGGITTSTKNAKLREKIMIHQRFYAALALNDLVNEIPITTVSETYNLNKGVIQGLQQNASTFAGQVTVFCERLGWSSMGLLLSQFQERLQFGVQRELCDLVRLSTMNGQRARVLYDNGIKTVQELAASDPAAVEAILHKASPFHSAVHGEAQPPRRHIWMVGFAEGLSELEAAQKIVNEARHFIQKDLGLEGELRFEKINLDDNPSLPSSQNKTGGAGELLASADIPSSEDEEENEVQKEETEKHSETSIEEKQVEDVQPQVSNQNQTAVVTTSFEESSQFELIIHHSSRRESVESVKEEDNQIVKIEGNQHAKPDANIMMTSLNSMFADSFVNDESLFRDMEENAQKLEFNEDEPKEQEQHCPSPTLFEDEGHGNDDENEEMKIISNDEDDILEATPPLETPRSRSKSRPRSRSRVLLHSTPGRNIKKNVSYSLMKNRISSIAFGTQSPFFDEDEDAMKMIKSTPKSFEERFISSPPHPSCSSNYSNSKEKSSSEVPLLGNPKSSTPKNPNPGIDPRDEINTEILFELNKEFDSREESPKLENKLTESVLAAAEALANDDSKFGSEDLFADVPCLDDVNEDQEATQRVVNPVERRISITTESGTETDRSTTVATETDDDYTSTTTTCSAFEDSSEVNRSRRSGSFSARDLEPYQEPITLFQTKMGNRGELKVVQIFAPESQIPVSFFQVSEEESFPCISIGLRHTPPKKSTSIARTGIGSRVVGKSPSTNSSQNGINHVQNENLHEFSLGFYNGTMGSVYVYQWKQEITENPMSSVRRKLRVLFQRLKTFSSSFGYLVGFDLKDNLLKRLASLDLLSEFPQERLLDPKIAQWILRDQEGRRCDIRIIGENYMDSTDQRIFNLGWGKEVLEAFVGWHVVQKMEPELRSRQLWDPLIKMEMPSVLPLLTMEMNGMALDLKELEILKISLEYKAALLELRAFHLSGKQFSLSSTKDIAKILFEVIGVKRPYGTKGTSKSVLSKIDHEMAKLIMEWRKLQSALDKVVIPFYTAYRMKGLEGDSLRASGHYSYFTVTGRLVMAEPSLQVIPRDFELEILNFEEQVESNLQDLRTKFGTKISSLLNQIETCKKKLKEVGESSQYLRASQVSMRQVFIPCAKEFLLLSADYSQLELRILAHLSGDKGLLQVLNKKDGDVFVAIAAGWKKVKPEQVTPSMRQEAKGIIYGVIYGMGCKALSEQMDVEEKEAVHFIQEFMRTYPGVKTFLEQTKISCRKTLYCETITGRRRYLPHINSNNPAERAQGERQAVNSKIQGSAADLVKTAMSKIHSRMKDLFPQNKELIPNWHNFPKEHPPPNLVYLPILNLHDELIFEVRRSHLPQIAKEIKEQMECCIKLDVRIPVVIKVGESWGDLHPFEE